METIETTSEEMADHYLDLVQRFIRLRPKLILPEHIVRYKQQFKKQMEALRPGGSDNPEDFNLLLHVVIILAQSETSPTMGELSTNLEVPFSTATRIVDWLENGHFVERIDDPNDRRIVRVRLTGTGRSLYQTTMEFNRQRITQMLSNFSTEEQAQLLHLMQKLLDSFNIGK